MTDTTYRYFYYFCQKITLITFINMKKIITLLLFCIVAINNYAQYISPKEKNTLKNYFMSMCREMNQQTPIRVDDTTTLMYVTFTGWTLSYHYKMADRYNDFTDSQRNYILSEIKKNVITGWKREIRTWDNSVTYSQYVSYLAKLGIKFNYTYVDCNSMPFGNITITCRDLK